jgi:hypothetical protein
MDSLDPSPGAPSRLDRLYHIVLLKRRNPNVKVFVSVEPIMAFTLSFIYWLRLIAPIFVYIGYDNYYTGLTEPSLTRTRALIEELKQFTEVREKTLRERVSAKITVKNIKKLEDYL